MRLKLSKWRRFDSQRYVSISSVLFSRAKIWPLPIDSWYDDYRYVDIFMQINSASSIFIFFICRIDALTYSRPYYFVSFSFLKLPVEIFRSWKWNHNAVGGCVGLLLAALALKSPSKMSGMSFSSNSSSISMSTCSPSFLSSSPSSTGTAQQPAARARAMHSHNRILLKGNSNSFITG